jgi:hypothetical protein
MVAMLAIRHIGGLAKDLFVKSRQSLGLFRTDHYGIKIQHTAHHLSMGKSGKRLTIIWTGLIIRRFKT